jgi:amino acid permease
MENPKLGKLLIVVGIIFALISLFVLPSIVHYFIHTYSALDNYWPWILFIIGIIIAIYGEYLDRK